MIDKLIEEIEKKNAPVAAGLDPMLSYIPEALKESAYEEVGADLSGAAEAVWRFNRAIVDAIADIVPVVKLQSAMYEQFGVPGVAVFERTVRYCHEKGLIVIGDVKRGDIGSTSWAYAAGHLGSVQIRGKSFSAFNEDFATVNPYLGSDGVLPFADVCKKEGKGIFVLVKTSNLSSGEFQDRLISGRPLYELVAEKVDEWGKLSMGNIYSDVGCVVGATYPDILVRIRSMLPHTYMLIPGYGAQGGRAEDVAACFMPDGYGALVASSRGIIDAWQSARYQKFGGEHFADAARQAALDMTAEINAARGKSA